MGILSVLALPLLLLGISGIIYIYQSVRWLLSKSAVQNKVVVITDAISGLGKGELSHFFSHFQLGCLALCSHRTRNGDALEWLLVGTLEAENSRFSELRGADLQASTTFDLRSWKRLLRLSDGTEVVGVWFEQNCVISQGEKLRFKALLLMWLFCVSLFAAILPNMIFFFFGQIVLINSIQGIFFFPFRAAYAASKHAAVGFFDCLRAEIFFFYISVSTVSPTFIFFFFRPPAPGNWEASIFFFKFGFFFYGVHPVEVAEEVFFFLSRRKQEVLMANLFFFAAVYIRTFFPELFFFFVASGIREKLKTFFFF
ncbi:DRS7C reductase, partial [Sylvietta virens]|nr:DRS7C reductase [Sylvietta virens]